MKKGLKYYVICWALLLVAFNAIVFLARPIIPEFVVRYDARFWISWGFITVAFIGNLICACITFREQNLKKTFYRISIVKISYSGMISMTVIGALLMIIPNFPAWIAAIICIIIFAINAVSLLKATAAVDIVESIDEKIKTETQFVKLATVNAENVMNRAKNSVAKAECEKVYEAIRYSDPMSNDALCLEEAKITAKIGELSNAVDSEADNITEIAEEIILLVKERNNKCKALK